MTSDVCEKCHLFKKIHTLKFCFQSETNWLINAGNYFLNTKNHAKQSPAHTHLGKYKEAIPGIVSLYPQKPVIVINVKDLCLHLVSCWLLFRKLHFVSLIFHTKRSDEWYNEMYDNVFHFPLSRKPIIFLLSTLVHYLSQLQNNYQKPPILLIDSCFTAS